MNRKVFLRNVVGIAGAVMIAKEMDEPKSEETKTPANGLLKGKISVIEYGGVKFNFQELPFGNELIL